MAKVWFARLKRAEWIVPGGRPSYEMPLAEIQFKLDLGPQRWVGDLRPQLASDVAQEEPGALQRVFVETVPEDIDGELFSGFEVGFYDSPYTPAAVAQRLS